MDDSIKHIGHLLAMARKINGLSAAEVGRRCNVTRGRVYQWEKQTFILPKNLPAISAALGIPLPMLLMENGEKPKKILPCLKLNTEPGSAIQFTFPSSYS